MHFRQTRLILLLPLNLSIACAQVSTNQIGGAAIADAHRAIMFCADAFSSRVGPEIYPDSVNRAYAFAQGDQIEVRFTIGELGLFGKVDDDYSSDLACGVINRPTPSLYMLFSWSTAVFVEDKSIPEIGARESDLPLTVLMFRRKGRDYSFDRARIYRNNDEYEADFARRRGIPPKRPDVE